VGLRLTRNGWRQFHNDLLLAICPRTINRMNDSKPQSTLPKSEESTFRKLLSTLIEKRGDTPDWPHVLLPLLQGEFQARLKQRVWYTGARLLIDRDDKDPTDAKAGLEKSATRMLFKRCRDEASGCFTVGDRRFWLLSYEVPNFSNRSRQCADLVGLSDAGGVVVFECKLENPYSPLTSLIEGLDYLSCLVAEPNFGRLRDEFQQWRAKSGQLIPQGFEDVTPRSSASEVIVLGSPAYYAPYRQSRRGEGWGDLATLCERWQDQPKMGFAVTDFQSTSAAWIAS